MSEKKLFPGISQVDIDIENRKAKELEEQKKREAKDAEEKRIKDEFDAKVQSLKQNFGPNFDEKRKATRNSQVKRFFAYNFGCLGFMYALWIAAVFCPDNNGKSMKDVMKGAISSGDIIAFDKVYDKTNSNVLAFLRAFINPILDTYNYANLFDADAYTGIKKSQDLRVLRTYFGIFFAILSAVLATIARKQDLKEISKEEKVVLDDIARVLKCWERGEIDRIDPQYIDLIHNREMVYKIISHLSREDAMAFRKVLEGDTYIKPEVAVNIIEGHLQSHPEDVDLVLDTFDEKSLILSGLFDKMNEIKQKNNEKAKETVKA